jgi:hypothetical protein
VIFKDSDFFPDFYQLGLKSEARVATSPTTTELYQLHLYYSFLSLCVNNQLINVFTFVSLTPATSIIQNPPISHYCAHLTLQLDLELAPWLWEGKKHSAVTNKPKAPELSKVAHAWSSALCAAT